MRYKLGAIILIFVGLACSRGESKGELRVQDGDRVALISSYDRGLKMKKTVPVDKVPTYAKSERPASTGLSPIATFDGKEMPITKFGETQRLPQTDALDLANWLTAKGESDLLRYPEIANLAEHFPHYPQGLDEMNRPETRHAWGGELKDFHDPLADGMTGSDMLRFADDLNKMRPSIDMFMTKHQNDCALMNPSFAETNWGQDKYLLISINCSKEIRPVRDNDGGLEPTVSVQMVWKNGRVIYSVEFSEFEENSVQFMRKFFLVDLNADGTPELLVNKDYDVNTFGCVDWLIYSTIKPNKQIANLGRVSGCEPSQ